MFNRLLLTQNQLHMRTPDRHQAEDDCRTNVGAEQRIEDLRRRLAAIKVNKLDRIGEVLEKRLPVS